MDIRTYNTLLDLFMEYKGMGFVSFQYQSKTGEISKRLVNVGASFKKAVKFDIRTLNNGIEFIPSDKYTKFDWDEAIRELRYSLNQSYDTNHADGRGYAYIYLNEENHSVKYAHNTLDVYLFGKSEKKTSIQPGLNKPVKSKPKTIAKNVIKSTYLKTDRFRTFFIKNMRGTVKFNNHVIEVR